MVFVPKSRSVSNGIHNARDALPPVGRWAVDVNRLRGEQQPVIRDFSLARRHVITCPFSLKGAP